MSAIVSALTQCELEENNNLVEILSVVRSSRRSQSDAKLALVVRGLCTQNLALLALLRQCDQEMANDEKEVFKTLVNNFIVWFEDALVVFERYLLCFPLPEDYDYAKFLKPVLHVGCYSAFIDLAIASLRNPFIVEKLTSFRCNITSLLDRYSEHLKLRNLDKISFDNVQAFGGNKVSCSFTIDEIVDRTKNEPLSVGLAQVELLLLNLKSSSGAPRSPGSNFNALAVLQRQGDDDPRLLMYPPFRINEVAIGLSKEGLSLQAISFFSKAPVDNITISGKHETLERWHGKLSKILPQINNKFIPNDKLELAGLGISCLSSDEDSADSPNNDSFASFTPPSEDMSDEEVKLPAEIMKKTLQSGRTSTGEVIRTMNVVNSVVPGSAKAEYCHADDVESVISSDDDEELEASFEMVKPKPKSVSPPQATVYRNAAGSAINIHEFGKNYNPSFASVNEIGERKPKKNFLSSLFKKNKSKESLVEKPAELAPVKEKPSQAPPKKTKPAQKSAPKTTSKPQNKAREPRIKKPVDKSKELPTPTLEQQKEARQVQKPPPLDLSNIPKNSEASSGPLSATSSTFRRTLPSPFALPSSTSTYFFKPPTPAPVSNNNSSTSLTSNTSEQPLKIPGSLKDVINSDSTIDFYITPTSPKTLKVSKWKHKCAKWEMLTTNENLFVKIVTNYEMHKAWLLFFKEEYDEEYDEVIDKPLLIMNLDNSTHVRKSSALDLEIQATNSIDSEKMLIMIRCLNGGLMNDLTKNLEDMVDMMCSKSPSRTTPSESNSTLMSSLMSKPSLSSTLTSIHLEDSRENSLSPQVAQEPQQEAASNMLLLDRMTVRLHKQLESYDKIHELSSWKTLAMYTLSVCHSAGSVDNGLYHLILESQGRGDEPKEISWSFGEEKVNERMEKIGKAGLLVRPGLDIYMIECKCKSQLRRLQGLF